MKVLLIGGGGREHALAAAFDRAGHTVYALPGSDAIHRLCGPLPPALAGVSAEDHHSLAEATLQAEVDLVIVGPEAPLATGIADVFKASGVPCFGPNRAAARLETSKAFSKAFMIAHGIPTADSFTCTCTQDATHALESGFAHWKGVVVKPSGLTAGKGVTVCTERAVAKRCIDELMSAGRYGAAGREVIVEEMLEGEELSVLAFCDGTTMKLMVPSQDHKRLKDGDAGPNTGGMGAYAPAPIADSALMTAIEEQVVQPTLNGMLADGLDYCGVIYFGVMVTEAGPKLLEYNCRFGDPEAQVVLPLLQSDLAVVMKACTERRLSQIDLVWSRSAACCVVMAAEGYPERPVRGALVEGVEAAEHLDGVVVYHAGTSSEDGRMTVAGGRVLGVVAVADELPSAVDLAYRGVGCIDFAGAQYRKDIAHRGLLATV